MKYYIRNTLKKNGGSFYTRNNDRIERFKRFFHERVYVEKCFLRLYLA